MRAAMSAPNRPLVCRAPPNSAKLLRLRRGRMILRCAKALVPLAAASLIPLPAHADVLEIGPGGEARWIAGAKAESAPLAATPLAEVPAEIAIVADQAL